MGDGEAEGLDQSKFSTLYPQGNCFNLFVYSITSSSRRYPGQGVWCVGSSAITWFTNTANPRIGRIWKCGDKVKDFYFVLGVFYGEGCAYGI